MSEMIERVARAICAANFKEKGSEGDFGTVDDCWWAFADQARAAIEAMREPTNDMLNAMAGEFNPHSAWSAAIDTALRSPTP